MSKTPIFDALWREHANKLGHAPGKGPSPVAAPQVNRMSMEELNQYHIDQAAMDDAPKKMSKPRKKKK